MTQHISKASPVRGAVPAKSVHLQGRRRKKNTCTLRRLTRHADGRASKDWRASEPACSQVHPLQQRIGQCSNKNKQRKKQTHKDIHARTRASSGIAPRSHAVSPIALPEPLRRGLDTPAHKQTSTVHPSEQRQRAKTRTQSIPLLCLHRFAGGSIHLHPTKLSSCTKASNGNAPRSHAVNPIAWPAPLGWGLHTSASQ